MIYNKKFAFYSKALFIIHLMTGQYTIICLRYTDKKENIIKVLKKKKGLRRPKLLGSGGACL